jgi:hypothetical protein
MAILHVVRCDGSECGQEAPLTATPAHGGSHISGMPSQVGAVYSVPSEWKQIDNRAFCSFRCLAGYADGKAKAQGD